MNLLVVPEGAGISGRGRIASDIGGVSSPLINYQTVQTMSPELALNDRVVEVT